MVAEPHGSWLPLGSGDVLPDVFQVLARHADVPVVVIDAAPAIAAGIRLIQEAISTGGRVVYVGAGTSGWLAALDAAETIVTFGMTGRVEWVVAGGSLLDPVAMTLGDDDVASVADDPVLASCGVGDLVIAVSASGSTPFTLAAVQKASGAGARVLAAVNRGDSPIARAADVAIVAETGTEIVSGSTRLTAGLAQKLILNTLSTVAMVRLGRSLDGHMVCVEPLNDKLRERLVQAVAAAAGVTVEDARAALMKAGRGDVATVSCAAGVDVDEAARRLERTGGNIRLALEGSEAP